MKKKFEIINVTKLSEDAIKSLEVEDYLLSISENRHRIRLSASQLSSISGMLLSSSFVIVFFLIKEKYSGILINMIYILMFGGIFLLLITMIFIMLSTVIPKPTSVANMSEKLNQQIIIFNREYRRLKVAQYSFVISICFFLIGLMLFLFKIN